MSTQTSFTIAQAAQQAGVSVHTLRYYEQAGLIAPVARARSGHRRYTVDAVGWIVFLTHLRATGMPIRRMRAYAELVHAGEHTAAERLAILETHRDAVRAQLAETAYHLERIEYKIRLYQPQNGHGAGRPATVDQVVETCARQPASSIRGP